jgi:Zn-dependent protease
MPISPLQILSSDPLAFALLAASLILAIALHEYGHALAADLQGDRMPRAMGRLSLNPARHLDPLGTLFIFLVGFGWGKPVEFRPQALSSKRFGAAIVALAGPMMNLFLAVVAAFAYVALFGADALKANVKLDLLIPGGAVSEAMQIFLRIFLDLNVLLAVFNLVPVPPLDGSRLLTIFLPPGKQKIIFFLDRWGFILLIGLLLFGGFTLFRPFIDGVESLIIKIAGA